MMREEGICGPSTSTASPPFAKEEGPSLHNMDGAVAGPAAPLPPLDSLSSPSTSSLPPLDTHFKINRWQNRNFDSGVQTMVHSQTQSLMSIHPSEISVMSGMTEDVSRQDLTDAQRCRFERLSICPSGDYEGSGLPELVQLMRDEDEAVVYKAVHMMQDIAKMDSEVRRERIISGGNVADALREVIEKRSKSANIVRVALGALFHLCNHPDGLRDVVELVGNEPGLLGLLIKHMRTSAFSSYKYAILVLHSILSDRSALGQAATAEARQRDALSPAIEYLRPDQSEKLLPIIVDLIKVLCEKSCEQKTRFIEKGGVGRLLDILQRCNYENLLWRTTKLLVQIANFSPSSLMTYHAPSILHTRLSHGSERLVLCILECLRAISDIASPQGTDATPVLNSIFCLFGHANPFISLFCVQIIFNMIANHRRNKEFLASKGITHLLMRVLSQSVHWVQSEKDKEISEEMQESLLGCLRHLCVRHDYAQQVCSEVMADHNAQLLLDRLFNMRPAILRQTLLILVQTSPLDHNLPSFSSTRLQREDSFITFVHQIVIILRVAAHQLPSAQPGVPLKVENVRVAELMASSMTILASLARDRRMMEETAYHLLQPLNSFIGDRRVFLPLFALEQPWIQDDSMTAPSLSLLAVLSAHQQIAALLQSANGFFYVLQAQARRPEPAVASPAHHLLSVLYNQPAPAPHSQSHVLTHDRAQPPAYDAYVGNQQYAQPQPGPAYPPAAAAAAYPMAASYPPPAAPAASHHHVQQQLQHHNVPPSTVPQPHHPQHHNPHHHPLPNYHRPEPSPEDCLPSTSSHHRPDPVDNMGPWPEDLAPLDAGGDPFAQVFCSPSSPPSPAAPAVFDAYVAPAPHLVAPPPNQYQPLPYPDPYGSHLHQQQHY